MSKKVTEGLTVVEAQIAAVKNFITSGKPSFRDYIVMRETLNIYIIQVVFGCTVKSKSKVAFNRPLPTMGELSKLHTMMKEFYETVELPFIENCNMKLEEDVNSTVMPIEMGANIPTFDKIKKKVVVDAMIGGSGSIMHGLFTPDQLLEMSALAEQLRAKIRRDQIIIIAGITLAVTAAAVTGYCVYRHNHKKDDEVCDVVDDDPDIDEIPHVDLDDDLS